MLRAQLGHAARLAAQWAASQPGVSSSHPVNRAGLRPGCVVARIAVQVSGVMPDSARVRAGLAA